MPRLLFKFLIASIVTCNACAAPLRYNRDVRPIIADKCFACHGPDKNHRKEDLRLDVREGALEKKAIVPGQPDASEAISRIRSTDPDEVMPPPDTHKELSEKEKSIIEQWIREGAVYEPHWAYTKLESPVVPPSDSSPVDAFIRAELKSAGLDFSPQAAPQTLMRRISLDLTGLPPSPQEVEAFAADKSPQAYEKLVDRLLASPHFGERMAVPWLDMVRYADTVGYHGDQMQRVFPYRDYVIAAFNSNKPFDQFTREQIAGDLLPKPSAEQLTATCFNRLNMMTREGGAQPKEYLARYAADRVRAVGNAWLGSTLGCAECHDHKFDPITTRDFYSMAAFFSDIKEWGVYNDYRYTPNPDLKGWSNDHPFPPEALVTSPALAARRKEILQQLEAKFPASAKWIEVPSSRKGDAASAKIAGPVVVGSLRIVVPENAAPKGFNLTVSARLDAAGKSKPVVLAEGYANYRHPQYSAGMEELNLQNGAWASHPEFQGKRHEAVFYLASPVKVGAGEQFVISINGKGLPDLQLAATECGGLLSGDGAAPLMVAAADWKAFLTMRLALAECRGGMAHVQIAQSVAPRQTRVLARGNWQDETGEIVPPNVLHFLPPMKLADPKARASRLDLANWLTSPDNPLTPRVFVNRLWKQFFGNGLAAGVEDMGAQGEPPTHPEVLEWLACDFRDHGWNVKRAVKHIVMSAAYRQSSAVREDAARIDSANRLLWRQNPRRLDAEFIRDQALASSGLLVREIGGPAIFPEQPAGYYANLNFPVREYPNQKDERRLRRGLYMHWQRTFLHPALANFDAPSREECQAERVYSNTPLQALTLLNDPNFVEAAQALAARTMAAVPSGNAEARINFILQHVISRSATAAEMASLVQFHQDMVRASPGDEKFVWASISRVALNLHESITRN